MPTEEPPLNDADHSNEKGLPPRLDAEYRAKLGDEYERHMEMFYDRRRRDAEARAALAEPQAADVDAETGAAITADADIVAQGAVADMRTNGRDVSDEAERPAEAHGPAVAEDDAEVSLGNRTDRPARGEPPDGGGSGSGKTNGSPPQPPRNWSRGVLTAVAWVAAAVVVALTIILIWPSVTDLATDRSSTVAQRISEANQVVSLILGVTATVIAFALTVLRTMSGKDRGIRSVGLLMAAGLLLLGVSGGLSIASIADDPCNKSCPAPTVVTPTPSPTPANSTPST